MRYLIICCIQSGGGKGQPKIDKKLIKKEMTVVAEWIKKEKMKTKKNIKKNEYRETLGLWLKEYSELQV